MHRSEPTLVRHLPIWRLVAGTCMVVHFLLVATPLASTLTVLLAIADPNHEVEVQTTARGIQVVLRHDCFHLPKHHHGIVARGLTLMAQGPVGGDPDHVIQFAGGAMLEQALALALGPEPQSAAPKVLAPDQFLRCRAVLIAMAAAHPRPPPDAGGLLPSFRSTILLL